MEVELLRMRQELEMELDFVMAAMMHAIGLQTSATKVWEISL